MGTANNATFASDVQTDGDTPSPFAERLVEFVIVGMISVLAFSGNMSLWLIVLGDRQLRTVSNWMILCLSAADLFVSAVNMPFIMFNLWNGRWLLAKWSCVVLGFFSMVAFISSVMSLASISWNRYMFICQPSRCKQVYTKTRTLAIIAGVWITSSFLAMPPLFGWGRYNYLPTQSICFCEWKTSISYTFFMVSICFGGPCSVMAFCYIKILKEVRDSKRRLDANKSNYVSRTATMTANVTAEDKSRSTNCNPNEDRKNVDARQDTAVEQLEVKPAHKTTSADGRLQKSVEERRMEQSTLSAGSISGSSSDGVKDKKNDCVRRQAADKMPTDCQESKALKLNVSDISLNHRGGLTSLLPTNKQQAKVEKKRREEMKLTSTFLVVILTFIILWMPFCVTMFISVFSTRPVARLPNMITIMLGCFNSCCNPIIYGVMNKRFRNGYARLYCSLCRKHPRKIHVFTTDKFSATC